MLWHTQKEGNLQKVKLLEEEIGQLKAKQPKPLDLRDLF